MYVDWLIGYRKVNAGSLRWRASARRSALVNAEEESRPIMAAPRGIESARLCMLEARKALGDYETLKGAAPAGEYMRLMKAFTKATETYLRLSASQR
jgi:hypothetical protein